MNVKGFIEAAHDIFLGRYQMGKVTKTLPLSKEEKAILKELDASLTTATDALIKAKNMKDRLKAMVGLRLDMFDAHQDFGFNPESNEVELYEQE